MAHIKGAQAILNIWAEPGVEGMNGWLNYILRGVQTLAVMAQTGAQIDMIKAQSFALGGEVGGNLHSSGGTMIEAERGEYVVRRQAVNRLGTPALDEMNQTGNLPSGQNNISVVVNFSGNVLSDEFIEEEAIPKIKDALARGHDLGIS